MPIILIKQNKQNKADDTKVTSISNLINTIAQSGNSTSLQLEKKDPVIKSLEYRYPPEDTFNDDWGY